MQASGKTNSGGAAPVNEAPPLSAFSKVQHTHGAGVAPPPKSILPGVLGPHGEHDPGTPDSGSIGAVHGVISFLPGSPGPLKGSPAASAFAQADHRQVGSVHELVERFRSSELPGSETPRPAEQQQQQQKEKLKQKLKQQQKPPSRQPSGGKQFSFKDVIAKASNHIARRTITVSDPPAGTPAPAAPAALQDAGLDRARSASHPVGVLLPEATGGGSQAEWSPAGAAAGAHAAPPRSPALIKLQTIPQSPGGSFPGTPSGPVTTGGRPEAQAPSSGEEASPAVELPGNVPDAAVASAAAAPPAPARPRPPPLAPPLPQRPPSKRAGESVPPVIGMRLTNFARIQTSKGAGAPLAASALHDTAPPGVGTAEGMSWPIQTVASQSGLPSESPVKGQDEQQHAAGQHAVPGSPQPPSLHIVRGTPLQRGTVANRIAALRDTEAAAAAVAAAAAPSSPMPASRLVSPVPMTAVAVNAMHVSSRRLSFSSGNVPAAGSSHFQISEADLEAPELGGERECKDAHRSAAGASGKTGLGFWLGFAFSFVRRGEGEPKDCVGSAAQQPAEDASAVAATAPADANDKGRAAAEAQPLQVSDGAATAPGPLPPLLLAAGALLASAAAQTPGTPGSARTPKMWAEGAGAGAPDRPARASAALLPPAAWLIGPGAAEEAAHSQAGGLAGAPPSPHRTASCDPAALAAAGEAPGGVCLKPPTGCLGPLGAAECVGGARLAVSVAVGAAGKLALAGKAVVSVSAAPAELPCCPGADADEKLPDACLEAAKSTAPAAAAAPARGTGGVLAAAGKSIQAAARAALAAGSEVIQGLAQGEKRNGAAAAPPHFSCSGTQTELSTLQSEKEAWWDELKSSLALHGAGGDGAVRRWWWLSSGGAGGPAGGGEGGAAAGGYHNPYSEPGNLRARYEQGGEATPRDAAGGACGSGAAGAGRASPPAGCGAWRSVGRRGKAAIAAALIAVVLVAVVVPPAVTAQRRPAVAGAQALAVGPAEPAGALEAPMTPLAFEVDTLVEAPGGAGAEWNCESILGHKEALDQYRATFVQAYAAGLSVPPENVFVDSILCGRGLLFALNGTATAAAPGSLAEEGPLPAGGGGTQEVAVRRRRDLLQQGGDERQDTTASGQLPIGVDKAPAVLATPEATEEPEPLNMTTAFRVAVPKGKFSTLKATLKAVQDDTPQFLGQALRGFFLSSTVEVARPRWLAPMTVGQAAQPPVLQQPQVASTATPQQAATPPASPVAAAPQVASATPQSTSPMSPAPEQPQQRQEQPQPQQEQQQQQQPQQQPQQQQQQQQPPPPPPQQQQRQSQPQKQQPPQPPQQPQQPQQQQQQQQQQQPQQHPQQPPPPQQQQQQQQGHQEQEPQGQQHQQGHNKLKVPQEPQPQQNGQQQSQKGQASDADTASKATTNTTSGADLATAPSDGDLTSDIDVNIDSDAAWLHAAACSEPLNSDTIYASTQDSQGRYWGWQGPRRCAYKRASDGEPLTLDIPVSSEQGGGQGEGGQSEAPQNLLARIFG